MIKVDMQRVRETLPKNGTAILGKENSICFIDCKIERPSLSEKNPMTFEANFQMIKDWQRQIVGEALSEFYTETTGQYWRIWLKRVPIVFVNTTDDDIKNYSGIDSSKFKRGK